MQLPSFTAIDFETATYSRNSACQVGVVRVERGVIVRELSALIRPPGNSYMPRLTEIHGIDAARTFGAPTFKEVWPQLSALVTNQRVVAHNGFSFDFSVLRQCLEHYGLATPPFEGICTYRLYRENLADLCARFDLELQHHDALSDARACAKLYLRWLKNQASEPVPSC